MLVFFLTFVIRFTDDINNKNGEERGIGYEIIDGEYVVDDDIDGVISDGVISVVNGIKGDTL